MNSEIPPPTTDGVKNYLSVWAESVCDVLGKITGNAVVAESLTPLEAGQEAEKLRQEGVWLRFSIGQALKGEQSFGVRKSDALCLARILMGEPIDANGDFSGEYQDALAELFRQFGGTAAVALKPRVGGEISLQLAGNDPGNWKPHVRWGIRLKNEAAWQFLLVILLDPELGASLASEPLGKAVQPPAEPKPLAPAPSVAPSRGTRNVELLLDVELQVALRFGKCEMQLGNILELSAGAVVELDQKILDPVELLVGGKVVAQGEVVVMDGHYALRVTEVLNPVARIESLAA